MFAHQGDAEKLLPRAQRPSMQSFPHSDEYSHFIAELRSVREEAGLSQAELAARLNIDRTLVTKAEGGVRRLDVIELRAWLIAIGTEVVPFIVRLEARLERNAKPIHGKNPPRIER